MKGYRQIGLEVVQQLEKIWKQSGMSQTELADMLGITQSVVSQTLRGRYPDWRISTIVRFASALGYEVEVTLKRKAR